MTIPPKDPIFRPTDGGMTSNPLESGELDSRCLGPGKCGGIGGFQSQCHPIVVASGLGNAKILNIQRWERRKAEGLV